MLEHFIPRTLLLATLAVFAITLSTQAAPKVGGKSNYTEYPGTATIVRVTKSADEKGAAAEGYEVWFTFKPAGEIPEGLGTAYLKRNPEHRLTLMNGWNPGPQFLKKYGIEKGKDFVAKLLVISHGTSTPVILEINGIDRADYSEAAPAK